MFEIISNIMEQNSNYMVLNEKLPRYIIDALPRCDDDGYIPVISYRKDNRTLFVDYVKYSCGTFLHHHGSCASNKNIDFDCTMALIDEVRCNLGIPKKFDNSENIE